MALDKIEVGMRLIKRALDRLRPTRRIDPLFGAMLFMGNRLQYWEARTTFSPTSSIIEVFVEGSKNDPMEQQHRFFNELVQEWQDLHKKISKLIANDLLGQEQPQDRQSNQEEVKISSISVPRGSLDEAEWEASFKVASQPHSLFTVRMKGRNPQNVLRDS